jgi:hypothetical protein
VLLWIGGMTLGPVSSIPDDIEWNVLKEREVGDQALSSCFSCGLLLQSRSGLILESGEDLGPQQGYLPKRGDFSAGLK